MENLRIKTAIQELIELMEKPSIHPVRQEVKEKAIELLEKEKEQIKHAFEVGVYSGCDQPLLERMPEDYYNETFKN